MKIELLLAHIYKGRDEMSELAFNINGEAFEVVEEATGWRVRKMRVKGSPEVVYAREGPPLVLPIGADIDDLRAAVDMPGRYRLDLVDQNNKVIEGAPSGYVHINLDVDGDSASSSDPSERSSSSTTSLARQSDNVVIEAMRMNSEIAKSVVDRFPMMLEAAATLLRAADGAGLPARRPQVVQEAGHDDAETDEEGEIDASSTGFDLNKLIAQLVPMLMTALASGSIKLPSAASVLDWRKATPTATKKAVAPAPPVADSDDSSDGELPPLDAKTMTHFISIQSVLDPKEAALAREVASSLSPTELRAWFDDLSRLSVPDAVTKIRTLLGAKKGSAS